MFDGEGRRRARTRLIALSTRPTMLRRVLVNNCSGSVEHYFHFLLGFCVPLVHFHLSERGDKRIPLAIRECGPLTPLIDELELNLRPEPTEAFHLGERPYPPIVLKGYDSVDRYDANVFLQFTSYLDSLTANPPRAGAPATTVLIERGSAPAYYLSAQAEIAGSGTARRAIGNHDELKSALAQRVPELANVQLEGRGLIEQFVLFRGTDVLIAQHGAALANMIFMRRGSRVIEIVPRGQLDFFAPLARTMGIHYAAVEQDGPFAPVNPQTVLDAIANGPERSSASSVSGRCSSTYSSGACDG